MAVQGTINFTQFRAEDWGATKRMTYGIYTGPKVYSNVFTNGGTGDPLIPGDMKLGQLHMVFFNPAINAAGASRQPIYFMPGALGGPPGGGVLWYQASTDAEVANGTDLSGYSCLFEALGI